MITFVLLSLVAGAHILITGGTGYIGSHTAVELIQSGYDVTLVDDLSNSKMSVLRSIELITNRKVRFYEVNCTDKDMLEKIFQKYRFDGVIHMAGLKAVGESIVHPLQYYHINIVSSLNLLELMRKYNVNSFVFSSSATVYGRNVPPGCTEDMETGVGITNPYGKTKYMIEEIIKDYASSFPAFSGVLLRYFNPIGAHPSGYLGEDPSTPPTNLMPIIMRVHRGELPYLEIYGDHYNTTDGSCIRDFIHVVDLAKGHLAALRHIKPGLSIYNLGTGHGTSVFEVVKLYEKSTNRRLRTVIGNPRGGDVGIVYANVSKANRELNWKAQLNVETAIEDTINYLSKDQPSEQTLINRSSSHIGLLFLYFLLLYILYLFVFNKQSKVSTL